MSYVKIKRNGAFEFYDAQNKFECVIPKDALHHYLAVPTRLEDEITLEEFLLAWPGIYEFIPFDFSPYLKELKEKVRTETMLTHLELSRPIVIEDLKSKDITASADVRGVDTNNPDIAYSVEFLRLNDMKNLPIKICHRNEVTFLEYDKDEKIHSRKMDTETTSGNEDYFPSLLEVYYSFVWEFTWHGSPSVRDAEQTRLFDLYKKYTENLDGQGQEEKEEENDSEQESADD